MPTAQELEDLARKCDWTWTIMNGVNGYVVRGRGDYVSASIFLPCAGLGSRKSLHYAGTYGYYWSSVPNSDHDDQSWYIYFNPSFHSTYYIYNRYFGQTVRPVQGLASWQKKK